MLRATLAGLLAFGLAGVLFGRFLWAVVPDSWSVDALNAAGFVAIAIDAAAGGLVGAWQARRAGLRGRPALIAAVLGPLLGALAVLAIDPDASLWTLAALAAVIGAAGASGAAWLGRRPAY
jgi:hypothetical protein